MTRNAVIKEAMTWLGTPWQHRQRCKGAGVDCLMFLAGVYAACGLIPDEVEPPPYPEQWNLHRSEELYLAGVEQYGRRITGPPAPGDTVVFKFGRCHSHGGIVLSWPRLIHAYRPQREVVISDAARSGLIRRSPRFYTFWD